DGTGLTADHLDSFGLDLLVEFLISLAETAHVDIEVIDLGIMPAFIFQQMRILKGIHAAGAGAVFMVVFVSAAYAMENRHALRRLGELERIFQITFQEFAGCRPGGAGKMLEFDIGEDVPVLAVAVLGHLDRIHRIETGGNDDGTDVEGLLLIAHLMVNGAGLALSETELALAAAAAIDAAGRLGPGLLLVEPQLYFPVIVEAVFNWKHGHLRAG